MDYDVYIPNRKERLTYYGFSFLAGFGLLFVFYDSIIGAIGISLLITLKMRKQYGYYLKNKRKELIKTQFLELLQSLSASVSAGRQMGEALEEGLIILKNSYSSESPLVMELESMVKKMKECREEEEQLLKDFANRVKITDISNFVEVYAICKETGGDMEKAIVKTSKIIMDKLSIEKDMKVLSAQKKFEGKLISLMPVLVIIFLRISSPTYLAPLYHSLAGAIIMTFSLIGMGYAYYLTDKITKSIL